jgi:succinoglycan biosynthesis transport protein ExoP
MRSSAREDVVSARKAHLAQIVRNICQKRWLILGPTILAFVVAAVWVNVIEPRYSAEARLIQIDKKTLTTGRDKIEPDAETALDTGAGQSQFDFLTSRELARRVVKQLSLDGNDEFNRPATAGRFERAMRFFGINSTQPAPDERILQSFSERLTVQSQRNAGGLTVAFSSRDPDMAARAANAIADVYIEMQQEAKRENARAEERALSTTVDELQSRVAAADARIEEFRVKSGLLLGSDNATLSIQQVREINTQLSLSQAARAEAEAKAAAARDMLLRNKLDEIPGAESNEFLRWIAEKRATLKAQLTLESRTRLPKHPRIKQLSAELADYEAQWRAVAEKAALMLENDARIAQTRAQNLARVLDEQKHIAGAATAEEAHLHELERTSQLLKGQLEVETTKYRDAAARQGREVTHVIARAVAPQAPSFPKKLPITVLATIAVLVSSLGIVIASDVLARAPSGGEAPHPVSDDFGLSELAALLRQVEETRVNRSFRSGGRS